MVSMRENPKWSKAIKSFLGFLEGTKKSPNTIKNYRSDLTTLNQYFEENSLEFPNINESHFRRYLSYLEKRKFGENTQRRKFLTARTFFEYLQKRKLLDQSPAQMVAPKNRLDEQPWVPNPDTLSKIMQSLKIKWPDSLAIRNYCLLGLASETGLQLSQLVKVTWTDLSGESFLLPGGEKITLSKELVNGFKKLRQVAEHEGNSGFVFWGSNRHGVKSSQISPRGVELVVKAIAKNQSLPKLKPRSFRHYAALNWISQGVCEREVLDRLGLHSESALTNWRKVLKNTASGWNNQEKTK